MPIYLYQEYAVKIRRSIFSALVLLVTLPVTVWAQKDTLLPPGADNTTIWHGVYLPAKRTIKASQILNFEQTAGKKVGVAMYYVGWYINAWADVQRQINVWEPMGIKTHVVWEPRLKGGKDPLEAIENGSQDAIIKDFAAKAKAYGQPFFLRFAHEMNGDWYPWSGFNTGGATNVGPAKYVSAWQRVWWIFKLEGADNVVWVWAPNWKSVPDKPWNALQSYYPGNMYVDWVGVDFYGLRWDNESVATNLAAVSAYAYKPIMVAETSAADCANYYSGVTPIEAKANWIKELFTEIEVPTTNVRAVFWFNENKTGEADWTLDSCPSPATRNAYRDGIGDARYKSR